MTTFGLLGTLSKKFVFCEVTPCNLVDRHQSL